MQLNEFAANFMGYRLIESPFLGDKVQARKHKKKRINKKWRKRYGFKVVPWKKVFITDGKIYGHPTIIALIKEEISRKGKP